MILSRRHFLRAAGSLASLLPLGSLVSCSGRGPLPSGMLADPDGILDLREGFRYVVIERAGEPMEDGYRVPGRPDGMACFSAPDGSYVLMRNHEISPGDCDNSPYYPGQSAPPEAYNPAGFGGVTRVVVDPTDLSRISSNLVLIGSSRNCAGGPSPWGWLSCEETVVPGHGYVFLCSPEADRVAAARPIVGYGRYNHEAVAVDPATSVAYLTEDRNDGALYRFVPDTPDDPFSGRLQAMAVVGQNNLDTSSGFDVGETRAITWVDVREPDPAGDTVRREAAERGAAIIKRGEGICYADGQIYICSTTGGPTGNGQLFALDIAEQTLTVVAHSEDGAVLDNPDNITTSAEGDLVMAEDGGGDQYVRVLAADGDIYPLARNARSSGEMAGVCFSPDGRVLFVNLQIDGITVAITGDFASVGVPPGLPRPR